MFSKIFRKDKQFIFTLIAVLGVGLTTASAKKDTTKAYKLISTEKSLRSKIKKTWRCYIPTGIVASSTIACIICSDYISMKERESLLISLTALQNDYKALKTSVDEVSDYSNKDQVLNDNIRNETPTDLYLERTGEKVFYEEYRNDVFISTIDNVLKAEYLLNKQLYITGKATVNDFYKYLGISETEAGQYLEWSILDHEYENSNEKPFVDFTHLQMDDSSGMEYLYLGFSNKPL